MTAADLPAGFPDRPANVFGEILKDPDRPPTTASAPKPTPTTPSCCSTATSSITWADTLRCPSGISCSTSSRTNWFTSRGSTTRNPSTRLRSKSRGTDSPITGRVLAGLGDAQLMRLTDNYLAGSIPVDQFPAAPDSSSTVIAPKQRRSKRAFPEKAGTHSTGFLTTTARGGSPVATGSVDEQRQLRDPERRGHVHGPRIRWTRTGWQLPISGTSSSRVVRPQVVEAAAADFRGDRIRERLLGEQHDGQRDVGPRLPDERGETVGEPPFGQTVGARVHAITGPSARCPVHRRSAG